MNVSIKSYSTTGSARERRSPPAYPATQQTPYKTNISRLFSDLMLSIVFASFIWSPIFSAKAFSQTIQGQVIQGDVTIVPPSEQAEPEVVQGTIHCTAPTGIAPTSGSTLQFDSQQLSWNNTNCDYKVYAGVAVHDNTYIDSGDLHNVNSFTIGGYPVNASGSKVVVTLYYRPIGTSEWNHVALNYTVQAALTGTVTVQQPTVDGYMEKYGLVYDDSDFQQWLEFQQKYGKNGAGPFPGNIIQDSAKWNDRKYERVLSIALREYLKTKYPKSNARPDDPLGLYTRNLIQNADKNCLDCKEARYEFASFVIPAYLNELINSHNTELQKEFAEYVAYNNAAASRKLMESWNNYMQANFGNAECVGLFSDCGGNSWKEPNHKEYKPYYQTLSGGTAADNPALEGKSVSEFRSRYMRGAPFFFSNEQLDVISSFVTPAAIHLKRDHPAATSEVLAIPDYFAEALKASGNVLKVKLDGQYGETIAASTGAEAAAGLAVGGAILGVGIGHTAMLSATASPTATLTADAVAFNVAANVNHALDGSAAKIAADKATIAAATSASATTNATIASAATGVAIGPGIYTTMGTAIVLSVIFGAKLAHSTIEIANFEDKLKRDSYINVKPIHWHRMNDDEKFEKFLLLLKMLIIDPVLSVSVPGNKADNAKQKQIELAAIEWSKATYGQTFPGSFSTYTSAMASFEKRYNEAKPVNYGDAVLIKNMQHAGHSYLEIHGIGCEPGSSYCVSAAEKPDTLTGDSVWYFVPLNGAQNGEPIMYGDFVHIENRHGDRVNYLDINHGGCEGNLYCVSAAPTATRDRQTDSTGTAIWWVAPYLVVSWNVGSPVQLNDNLHLTMSYNDTDSFLDVRGTGCEGNAWCVSTAATSKFSGSGVAADTITWQLIPVSDK